MLSASVKEQLMVVAMSEAEKAINSGNSPFGAVLADFEGNIVAEAHNTANTDMDPTAHAEMNLIRIASKKLCTKNLSKYYMISNAQSCSMCFSAAIKAKINKFIFGAKSEPDMNPDITVFDIEKKSKNKLFIETGVLEKECSQQIKQGRECK